MGVANSMSRPPIKILGEDKFMVLRTILTTTLLTILFIFNTKGANFIFLQILFAIGLAVICYFALILMYKSFSIGKLGVVAPITGAYTLISIILTLIFFHTKIETNQIIGICVITASIFLGSANFKDFDKSDFLNKKTGIPQAVGCFLLWGAFFFLAQIPTKALGPYLAALCFEIGILLCSLVRLYFIKDKSLKIEKKAFSFVTLMAFISVVGTALFYYGINNFNPAIILALSGATPLVATVYGLVVYKEKLTSKQFLTSLCIIGGIILLSI